MILAAVDRSLGIDLNVAISNAKQVGSTKVCFDRYRTRAHVHHTIHTKPTYVQQYTDVPNSRCSVDTRICNMCTVAVNVPIPKRTDNSLIN